MGFVIEFIGGRLFKIIIYFKLNGQFETKKSWRRDLSISVGVVANYMRDHELIMRRY